MTNQRSVNELLRTIANFDHRTQEGLIISLYDAVDSSRIRRLTAKARRLRERLDASDAHCHY